MSFIHHIPILTTLFAIWFFIDIYKHWSERKEAIYLLWWTAGVFCYGAGTLLESLTTLFDWQEPIFRLWYIFGAFLGGAPLAQGTVYLFITKRKADVLSVILILVVVIAALFVWLSPINYGLVEEYHLTGKVLVWKEVRLVSPFINTYAFIFLVGGAIYSAIKYSKDKLYKNRFRGNLLIAIGAILPGIGGTFTRFGYTEVLYVTEFFGLLIIYIGYKIIRSDSSISLHKI